MVIMHCEIQIKLKKKESVCLPHTTCHSAVLPTGSVADPMVAMYDQKARAL